MDIRLHYGETLNVVFLNEHDVEIGPTITVENEGEIRVLTDKADGDGRGANGELYSFDTVIEQIAVNGIVVKLNDMIAFTGTFKPDGEYQTHAGVVTEIIDEGDGKPYLDVYFVDAVMWRKFFVEDLVEYTAEDEQYHWMVGQSDYERANPPPDPATQGSDDDDSDFDDEPTQIVVDKPRIGDPVLFTGVINGVMFKNVAGKITAVYGVAEPETVHVEVCQNIMATCKFSQMTDEHDTWLIDTR